MLPKHVVTVYSTECVVVCCKMFPLIYFYFLSSGSHFLGVCVKHEFPTPIATFSSKLAGLQLKKPDNPSEHWALFLQNKNIFLLSLTFKNVADYNCDIHECRTFCLLIYAPFTVLHVPYTHIFLVICDSIYYTVSYTVV